MSADPMVARDQLKSVVERVERLEEEKKAIADDIRDVYAEAKANGFDTKVLRQVVALRKKDLTERQEEEAVRDLYLVALGMLPEFEAQSQTEAGSKAEELLTDQESRYQPSLLSEEKSENTEEGD